MCEKKTDKFCVEIQYFLIFLDFSHLMTLPKTVDVTKRLVITGSSIKRHFIN